MTVTTKDVLEMDGLLSKYVVRPQRPQLPPTHPQYAAQMADYEQHRAEDVVGRVARCARFSAGLGRNINLMQAELKLYNETLRGAQTEKIDAYQKAAQAVQAQNLPAEEQAARLTALAEEHKLGELNQTIQSRREELLVEETGIARWYRIPLTALPGWGDPDNTPETDRRGVIDPLDIAYLLQKGLLYDSEVEDRDGTPVPVKK